MVLVTGATREYRCQPSRHERTNLRQKFYRLWRFAAQGVGLESANARLNEIAQEVNGVRHATAAIAFLISPQRERYFSETI
jgi:hypothetical protein